MKTYRKALAATAGVAALTLAGCWGGNNDEPVATPAGTEVPGSAGLGTAAFVSYLLTLGASDESADPLTLNGTFAVPAEETDEPTPLT